jgi:acyl phosphate:glycerol-3-phosphate acyltransferase
MDPLQFPPTSEFQILLCWVCASLRQSSSSTLTRIQAHPLDPSIWGGETVVAKPSKVVRVAQPCMSFKLSPTFSPLTGQETVWIIASYLIGCFTAGYYWTRWRTGQDIRDLGSGNVGARNVGRALGPGGFTVTFLLDLAKGFLAVAMANHLALRPEAVVASIVAVVVGHNWPMQLRFQGGKGIAVSVGALLAYEPLIVGGLMAVFVIVIAILRNFTLSGMLAFALGPLGVFLGGMEKERVAAVSLLAILVLVTHRKNIRQEVARLAGASVKEAPVQMHKGPHDEV